MLGIPVKYGKVASKAMNSNEAERRLKKAEDLYWNMIKKVAEEIFYSEIVPFLEKRQLNFVTGNGSYCIYTSCEKERNIYLGDYPNEKFQEIYELLELYADSQSLGSLMPSYYHKRK